MSISLSSPSSSDKTAFAYNPLSAEADTRLIELDPAPDASFPLQCRISEICLSSDDLIGYEALSYTWGAPEFTETLHVIQGEDKTRVIKITTNLRDALQHIRLNDRKRLLWVDAVCINQKDDSDKSKQIPVMAHIYSAAFRVLVWLGTSLEGQRSLVNIKKAQRFYSRDSQRIEAHLSNLETCFNDLVSLPWFSRRWIIQEVVLAADVIMMCGAEEISLTHLFRVMNDFVRKSKLPRTPTPLEAISKLWKTLVFDSNQEAGLRLFELLSVFHESDCQVGLDRIYALCNLASDCVVVDKKGKAETDKISIVVDYNQTAEYLYQSVVEQILGLETNGEGITRRVGGHHEVRAPSIDIYREVFGAILERCDGSRQNTEAWVPDWRLPKRREPLFKSLDDKRQIDYSHNVYAGLIGHDKAALHDRSRVVSIVLEPFPEDANITEIKSWLQTMRDRFADYQPQLIKCQLFSRIQKRNSEFLIGNSSLDLDSSPMSLDVVWRRFLSTILDQGLWWHPTRDGRDVVEENARNLYLLSLGMSEVPVSPECWSFLCLLFTGRRIFYLRWSFEADDSIWGVGIGPDHLNVGVFINVFDKLRYGEGLLSNYALLLDATTERVSTLVGDAWVLPFV